MTEYEMAIKQRDTINEYWKKRGKDAGAVIVDTTSFLSKEQTWTVISRVDYRWQP